MMRYINTKTQAVVETACEIKGGDWVKAEEQPKKTTKTASKKTREKGDER